MENSGWRLMGKPVYLCKLYTVSYDTYIQQVLKRYHFRRVFVTNIIVIDVARLGGRWGGDFMCSPCGGPDESPSNAFPVLRI